MKKIILFTLLTPMMFSCGGNKSNKPAVWNAETDTVSRCNIFDTTMKDSVSCYRIPSLVTAKNGDLIAAIDERVPSCGDLIWSKDINIVIRRSQDNGRTWSDIETVIDYPLGQSASDPSMIVDEKTGEIFLFYNYMDLDKEKNIFKFHVVSSKDNGHTWSKYTDITPFIAEKDTHKDFRFITSGRGVYTSDGRMLHTLVNLKKGLSVFGSDDHGKTWYRLEGYINPADESKIIELCDGRWMINSRVNNSGIRYAHVSADKGKTWTSRPDSVLVDPGCNGSIIRYSSVNEGDDKNRILISHAANAKERNNLTIRLSYDNGKTWAYSKTIHPNGSAYSSMSIMKNGDIAVFYEKDGHHLNEVATFSLGWLTDGKDTFKKIKK